MNFPQCMPLIVNAVRAITTNPYAAITITTNTYARVIAITTNTYARLIAITTNPYAASVFAGFWRSWTLVTIVCGSRRAS